MRETGDFAYKGNEILYFCVWMMKYKVRYVRSFVQWSIPSDLQHSCEKFVDDFRTFYHQNILTNSIYIWHLSRSKIIFYPILLCPWLNGPCHGRRTAFCPTWRQGQRPRIFRDGFSRGYTSALHIFSSIYFLYWKISADILKLTTFVWKSYILKSHISSTVPNKSIFEQFCKIVQVTKDLKLLNHELYISQFQ